MPFAQSLLRHEPLLIEPTLLTEFVKRAGWFQETVEELFGKPPVARIEDGIGIIPICGPIGQGLLPVEKMFGACDLFDVAAALEDFAANPKVRAVLLDLDTPGGTAMGVPEVSDLVFNFPKPTMAYTHSLACSAGYWIGSQAQEFVCTPSSAVGSVGVFMAWFNVTEFFGKMGVFTEVIKAGTYKAMGYPGTDLTDEQRALLQAEVDELHAEFRATVKRRRMFATDDAMEGQSFAGRTAAQRGLVTGLVPNRAAALARLTAAAA